MTRGRVNQSFIIKIIPPKNLLYRQFVFCMIRSRPVALIPDRFGRCMLFTDSLTDLQKSRTFLRGDAQHNETIRSFC